MKEQIFNEEGQNLAADITQIALQHGGMALSKMLKDEVLLKSFEIQPETFDILTYADHEEEIYVLSTEIVGDVYAQTYLLINQHNEDIICNKMLPNSVLGQGEMREAMLLEVDNIVIASLVTKYSNLLDANMHGHVPDIKKVRTTDIEGFIREREKEINVHFDYKVNLTSFKSKINMEMIAIFDDSLIPLIENFDYSKSYVGDKERPKEEPQGMSSFFKKVFHI